MIDLRRDHLPDSFVVDGERYPIDTSFRTWLKIEESGRVDASIFTGDVPQGEWRECAEEFRESKNPCPHGVSDSGPKVLDLIKDGDYIVASFQQAYGIDLTSCDMHWHRFLALLRGLPKDTKLSEIIGYRGWKKDRRKEDAIFGELRKQWSLPTTHHDPKLTEWAEKAFGNIEFGGEK